MNEGTERRRDAFSGQFNRLVAFRSSACPMSGLCAHRAAVSDGGDMVRFAIDAVREPHDPQCACRCSRQHADPVIMVGAHLDSVPEGPGINDNGSGAAAVLEAALRLGELAGGPCARPFRLLGCRGTRAYRLAPPCRGTLRGGAPPDRALHQSRHGGLAQFRPLRPGHRRDRQRQPGRHRAELLAGFRNAGLKIEERSGGRFGSDETSFSQKDIPTIGLYTGASSVKSEAEESLFGGVAGRPYDPCYHRACDTTENIDRTVLEQNTRALVRTLQALTMPGR